MTATVVPDFHRQPAPRPGGLVRAVAALAAAAVAWRVLPAAWVLLVGSLILLAWGALVLRAELERLLAIALIPLALVVALASAGWLFVVSPAIDRAVARVNEVTHPALPSVDVGGAAKGAVDKARSVVGGLTGGQP